MPVVLNKKKKCGVVPFDSVYVGRPSKWGNPYVIGVDGSRAEVISMYEQWLHSSGLINDVWELRGRDLVCFCAPSACHADVLLRLANNGVRTEDDGE